MYVISFVALFIFASDRLQAVPDGTRSHLALFNINLTDINNNAAANTQQLSPRAQQQQQQQAKVNTTSVSILVLFFFKKKSYIDSTLATTTTKSNIEFSDKFAADRSKRTSKYFTSSLLVLFINECNNTHINSNHFNIHHRVNNRLFSRHAIRIQTNRYFANEFRNQGLYFIFFYHSLELLNYNKKVNGLQHEDVTRCLRCQNHRHLSPIRCR